MKGIDGRGAAGKLVVNIRGGGDKRVVYAIHHNTRKLLEKGAHRHIEVYHHLVGAPLPHHLDIVIFNPSKEDTHIKIFAHGAGADVFWE